MEMMDPWQQLLAHPDRVVARDEGVAGIEIHAHQRIVEVLHQLHHQFQVVSQRAVRLDVDLDAVGAGHRQGFADVIDGAFIHLVQSHAGRDLGPVGGRHGGTAEGVGESDAVDQIGDGLPAVQGVMAVELADR